MGPGNGTCGPVSVSDTMSLISITGTPGTGKTSVSKELRSRGYKVIDINDHISENGLFGDKDQSRDTYEIDLDLLNDSLGIYRDPDEIIFMDSHLSHCLDCNLIIVLRCDPNELASRLRTRGYNEEKVRENVQAELLDVILCESMDSDIPVYELDCTAISLSEIVDTIVDIINGKDNDHPPGKIDWSKEMDEWF